LDLILILVIYFTAVDGERVWHGLTSIFRPKSRDGLTELQTHNLQQFVSGQLLLGLFIHYPDVSILVIASSFSCYLLSLSV